MLIRVCSLFRSVSNGSQIINAPIILRRFVRSRARIERNARSRFDMLLFHCSCFCRLFKRGVEITRHVNSQFGGTVFCQLCRLFVIHIRSLCITFGGALSKSFFAGRNTSSRLFWRRVLPIAFSLSLFSFPPAEFPFNYACQGAQHFDECREPK